jgi:hypothetical protein
MINNTKEGWRPAFLLVNLSIMRIKPEWLLFTCHLECQQLIAKVQVLPVVIGDENSNIGVSAVVSDVSSLLGK